MVPEEQADRKRRWAQLPEHVRLEDMTTAQDVEPGADSTWDVDYERYWSAHELR
ncbi:hypothetical protein AB0F91_04530 [Amycolatopsis sp. NPDC023774]|uniref:hypothetical protein n=1 Tax=Amycolatopsis sp. NPDC023774 TaxID=3155015 RepID=UPI0034078AF6